MAVAEEPLTLTLYTAREMFKRVNDHVGKLESC